MVFFLLGTGLGSLDSRETHRERTTRVRALVPEVTIPSETLGLKDHLRNEEGLKVVWSLRLRWEGTMERTATYLYIRPINERHRRIVPCPQSPGPSIGRHVPC